MQPIISLDDFEWHPRVLQILKYRWFENIDNDLNHADILISTVTYLISRTEGLEKEVYSATKRVVLEIKKRHLHAQNTARLVRLIQANSLKMEEFKFLFLLEECFPKTD